MALIRWKQQYEPTVAFDQLRHEINRLFEDVWGENGSLHQVGTYPPVNLYEDAENLYLTAELPGLSAENINIHIEGETILLSGERLIEKEGDDARYHRREREGGRFAKRLALPTRIDAERVDAAMENGILTVTMAKAEDVKPRKIEVNIV